MRKTNQRSNFFGVLPVLLTFFFSLLMLVAQAQQRQITGTVKDDKGNPVPSVSVTVKGSKASAVTALDGSFTISAKEGDVLVFSSVSFETAEVKVGSADAYPVVLTATSVVLTDVVVVGYGTQNKKDVTGAVKSLKSTAFNKGIINSPQQLLQGKVSGVNVVSVSGEPGVALGITIRGPGGVRTSNTPLFVVDGIPLDNNVTGRGDPLNFLNPQDIESIDVLKDASATAIYGSRGANGVVIITTKKGRAGTSQLGFSTSVGISRIARKYEVFTADEFRREVPKTGGTIDDKGASTDWQDEVFRTAYTQNYNLTLSGGADRLTYFASFGMQKQEGIMKANDLDRYSGRFNASQRFWDDRLTIDVTLGVTTTKNNRPFISTILGQAISNNPTYAARDANGNPLFVAGINNPLFSIDGEREFNTINRVLGSISTSLRIIKGLVYRFNFGIDNANGTNDIQTRPSVTPFREGRLETFYNYNRSRLVENYVTYNWVKILTSA